MASTINWNSLVNKKAEGDPDQLELDLEDIDEGVSVNSSLSTILSSTLNTTSIYNVLNGGTNINWTGTAPTYTLSNSGTISASNPWNVSNTLKVDGDAEICGDLTVKGVKLSERLDVIEQRLAILRPNNDLENRWEELKELGQRYRELENEILAKENLWNILKK